MSTTEYYHVSTTEYYHVSTTEYYHVSTTEYYHLSTTEYYHLSTTEYSLCVSLLVLLVLPADKSSKVLRELLAGSTRITSQ